MFKKRFTEIAVAVAMTMSAGAAQAVELAVNGGFETGDFTGWTQFPQSGGQVVSTINPSSGSYSGNLTIEVGTGPVDNVIKQANLAAGSIAPGALVDISFDMRGTLFGDGGVVFAQFFSELDGGGVSDEQFLGGGPLIPNETWTTYTFNDLVAGPDVSGGITLQLKAGCGAVASCGADVFFDNVSISADVSAIPVPAAVWLFGSGLVGLVGVARRKKVA